MNRLEKLTVWLFLLFNLFIIGWLVVDSYSPKPLQRIEEIDKDWMWNKTGQPLA